MAPTLQLTNGTYNIDLAMTIPLGYGLLYFRPSRPNRQLARVSGFPFADGNRTTASSLQDTTATIGVLLMGPNADDLDGLFQSLVRMCEDAQAWEERKIGAPVRLLFKHQGATNTSYRTVTGVPLMPQPIAMDDLTWLDQTGDCSIMAVEFTITLEPVAHATALDVVLTYDWHAGPGDLMDMATCEVIPGDMPAPIQVHFTNYETDIWSDVWMAVLGDTPAVDKAIGIPDATASGGAHGTVNIPPGGSLVFQTIGVSSIWEPNTTLPMRCIIRIRVPSGDPTLLHLRFGYTLGGTGQLMTVGPYVQLPNIVGEWFLLDLGTLRLPSMYLQRSAILGNRAVVAFVEGYSDSGTITLDRDYMQVLPYHSFVKLGASVGQNKTLIYESLAISGSYYWPVAGHQTYVITDLDNHETDATRQGRIAGLDAGSEPIVWAEALQDDGTHDIASAGQLVVSTLACYSLGLRGDA